MSTMYLVSTGRGTVDYTLKGIFRDKPSAQKMREALEDAAKQYIIYDYPDDIEEYDVDETSDYCCKQYWFVAVFTDNSERFHGTAKIISGWEPQSAQRDYAMKKYPHQGREVVNVTSFVSKEHLLKLIKDRAWQDPNYVTTV